MESIVEVEEECFSTNKTQSKANQSSNNHHLRSGSLKENTINSQIEVSVSDFSKAENEIETKYVNQQTLGQIKIDLSGNKDSINNFDFEKDSFRISFGKRASIEDLEKKTINNTKKNNTKKEDQSKESLDTNSNNRMTLNYKANGDNKKKASLISQDKTIVPSLPGLSLDEIHDEYRSKSYHKLHNYNKTPSLLSMESKYPNSHKLSFKTFKDVLISKPLQKSNQIKRKNISNEKSFAKKSFDQNNRFKPQPEKKTEGISPDIKQDFRKKLNSVFKIKIWIS